MYLTQVNMLMTLYYSSPLSASHSNYSFLFTYKNICWYIAIAEFNFVVRQRKSLRTFGLNNY